MEKVKLPEKVKVAQVATPEPDPVADHATVTCSKCNQTWNADENPYDYRCVGNQHHDLHGNSDGEGASETA